MGMGLLWSGRGRRRLVATGALMIAAAGIFALAAPASGWAVTFSNSKASWTAMVTAQSSSRCAYR
jgi:hypothetical protein